MNIHGLPIEFSEPTSDEAGKIFEFHQIPDIQTMEITPID
jgi:hypothetical protein